MGVNGTRWPRRATARLPESAREHVGLVSRLLVAQAGIAGALSLAFSRRSVSVILTTLVFVAVLCALAVLANTGTPTARTAVLGFEFAIVVFGLYRFAFERYLGGTVFAIVVAAVLLHPAVVQAYGSASPGMSDSAEPAPDPAGGALGEPAGR